MRRLGCNTAEKPRLTAQESWEHFRGSTLMPRMQSGIDGGFTTTPTETAFEIQHEEGSA